MLNISEEYLQELIEYVSSNTVGKVLKRIEIIDDTQLLKKEVKELLYEQFRFFKDLLEAHNRGLDIQIYNFKRQKEK